MKPGPATALLLGTALIAISACRHSLPEGRSMQPEADVFEGLATQTTLTEWMGQPPHACLSAGSAISICEWRLRGSSLRYRELASHMGIEDQVGVLCVLPTGDRERERDSCTLHQRRSNRDRTGTPGTGRRRGGSRSREIQDRVDAARRHIEAARTLVEMSRAMGQLPEHCVPLRPDDAVQRCQWRLTDQSAGHGSVARWIGSGTQQKIRFVCRFPVDGSPRTPESCEGHGL